MKLSRADIQALAAALADELHSRGLSRPGVGALVQGDDQWPENEKREHMDRINVDQNGESSKLRQLARERLSRLRAKPKPSRTSPSTTTRPKAAR